MQTSPSQFIRKDPYQVQLEKQQNAALELAAKKQKEADTAKKLKELTNAKNAEKISLKLKIAAEKKYAISKANVKIAQDLSITPSSPGGAEITPEELTNIQTLQSLADTDFAEVNYYTKQHQNAYNARISAEKAASSLSSMVSASQFVKKAVESDKTTKKTSTNPPSTDTSNAPKVPNPLKYYYNAPMVKYAYLRSGSGDVISPQQQTTNKSISGTQNYLQGLDAWKDTVAAKGVIQMDATNAVTYSNSSSTKSANYDGNLYGFKFLYNPKEVSMTWGVAEGMNWAGIAANLDPGSAPTAALKNSTITFTLLLNRILDMSYLDSNGLKPGVEDPYANFETLYGKDTELRYIYAKGTMYDLEYLFRSISGLNADFYSGLNGWTADRGWLYGLAAELHLGNYMRYRVRINNLDVNHVMFDERMVPILSYVNITCARFNYVSLE